ncbi:hypothetical protein [Sulfitobacter donghicola]|uniref:hypothetical protein n=1 Tax=Sulfitobacter donghicola TaxID=421000 RepID=UPI0012DCF9A0|nr:hypothetical protein [Sulfitobacter donghicola]
MGANALSAILRQAIHKFIILLETPAPKHPHLPIAGVETAQTLLRQVFTVHTLRQRTRRRSLAGLGLGAVAVHARGWFTPHLLLMRLAAFVFIFVVLMNKGPNNREPKNSCHCTGSTVVIGNGWCRGRCCYSHHGSCESACNTSRKLKAHLIDPYTLGAARSFCAAG